MARITVTKESRTGRNQEFHDNKVGRDMNQWEFVLRIKRDEYPGYHIRRIHGIETPVSNPDETERNNLG